MSTAAHLKTAIVNSLCTKLWNSGTGEELVHSNPKTMVTEAITNHDFKKNSTEPGVDDISSQAYRNANASAKLLQDYQLVKKFLESDKLKQKINVVEVGAFFTAKNPAGKIESFLVIPPNGPVKKVEEVFCVPSNNVLSQAAWGKKVGDSFVTTKDQYTIIDIS